jgi:DNA-binding GntR family transcriptional regulator
MLPSALSSSTPAAGPIGSPGLEPVPRPTTLNQAAVERLRDAIVTGALAPGALLKDAEIALWLGLSATPVREALVRLAAEGLVEIEPNRLKRVAPIDDGAMVDLLRVQIELWALGYAWGGPHVDAADLARLAQANAAHRDAIDRGDARARTLAAHDFHLVLMEASDNRELVRVSVDRLPLIQRYVLLRAPALDVESMLGHHDAMYRALAQGDVPPAIAAFRAAGGLLLAAAEALRDAPTE